MANVNRSRGTSRKLNAILGNSIEQTQNARRAKRLAQHKHWMRVMMEGQATPDVRYQKQKI